MQTAFFIIQTQNFVCVAAVHRVRAGGGAHLILGALMSLLYGRLLVVLGVGFSEILMQY